MAAPLYAPRCWYAWGVRSAIEAALEHGEDADGHAVWNGAYLAAATALTGAPGGFLRSDDTNRLRAIADRAAFATNL